MIKKRILSKKNKNKSYVLWIAIKNNTKVLKNKVYYSTYKF